MIKPLLIKLLFRLIDGPLLEHPADRAKIDDWMVMTWSHPGYRAYVNSRGNKILRELAGGLGMTERDRPDYIRITGQRMENLYLATMARNTFEKRQKERAKVGRKPLKQKRLK